MRTITAVSDVRDECARFEKQHGGICPLRYLHLHVTAGRGRIDSVNDELNVGAKARPLLPAENHDRNLTASKIPGLVRHGQQVAVPQLVPALLCRRADGMVFEKRTDWHRRCLIENNPHLLRVSGRFIQATNGELDNRLDLFPV